VAYAPNQYDTAELLSKMTGSTTVQKATFNFSGSRLSPVMNHVNASVDQIERPLITPDEVMRLRPAKKERQGPKELITAPGDMLIFVAGQYPIYGTQILYFKDPIFKARAALAPPAKLLTLVNGKPMPQAALDRTSHVISRPEKGDTSVSDGDGPYSSPMEQEFVRQLSKSVNEGSTATSVHQPRLNRLPVPEAYFEELDDMPHKEKEL
jgi:type IV secretion system protein VirD4